MMTLPASLEVSMYVAIRRFDAGRGVLYQPGQALPGAEKWAGLRNLLRSGLVEERPDPGTVFEYRSPRDQRLGGVEYRRGDVVPGAEKFRNLDSLVLGRHLHRLSVPVQVRDDRLAPAPVNAPATPVHAKPNRAERRAERLSEKSVKR